MRGIVAITGLLLSTLTWASHEIAISPQQMQQLGIGLGAVEPARGLSTDRLPARVAIPPQQERVVSAPQSGLITELQAAVGDPVVAGQPLATLNSPDLVALQRDFLQAVTQTRLAQTELQRDQRLAKEGIIAERRYLETRSRYDEAAAGLAERRQALQLAGMASDSVKRLQRERKLSSTLQVTAPIAGMVLAQQAVVGQRVSAADALYRIGQLEPLWLEIQVPVDRLAGVGPGTAVQVPPCPGVKAQVMVTGQNVDLESQTVLVRASVTEAEGCLRPGQFVQVNLRMTSSEAQFRVPESALVRSGDSIFVFAHEPNGFLPIGVQLVGRDEGYAVVTGELTASQQIAVSGLAAIKAAWLGMGGE